MTVTVRQRVSHEPVDEDITWPQNWPLPIEGSIVLGTSIGGWVDHIEFDLPAQRVLVVLR